MSAAKPKGADQNEQEQKHGVLRPQGISDSAPRQNTAGMTSLMTPKVAEYSPWELYQSEDLHNVGG